jgi:hypothetical protein
VRVVALTGCLLLAVFTPPTPTPTDTDVPPSHLLSTAPPPSTVPEAIPSAEDVPPPAPPMMAEGIEVEPAPSMAVRTNHGCDFMAELLCTQNPPPPPPRAEWQWCEEWHEMAAQIGWPEEQGRVLSYVMHRESGCRPGAYNPQPCGRAHALGLMQLCGWPCPPNGCFDPWSNLTAAFNLWQHSGWCPWVLRGDPMTGRACG